MIHTDAAGVACSWSAIAGKAVLAIAVSSEAMATPMARDRMAHRRASVGKPSRSARARFAGSGDRCKSMEFRSIKLQYDIVPGISQLCRTGMAHMAARVRQ